MLRRSLAVRPSFARAWWGRALSWLAFLGAVLTAASTPAAADGELDWAMDYRIVSEIRIETVDVDGALRNVPVWCVIADRALWVRTSDSVWLENIRRGSAVQASAGGPLRAFMVEERDEIGEHERIAHAFVEKYGFWQRVYDFVRGRPPNLLRLTPDGWN